jgi:nucleoside 2-deoxyribosyltransferase
VNIYTATKWERREAQSVINNHIEWLGHRITHDWTTWEEQEPSAGRRKDAAMLDLAGVMQADLLIYWDHPKANGARWECGMAVAKGIPVWIADYQNVVIFDALPQVSYFDSYDEILRLLGEPNPLA